MGGRWVSTGVIVLVSVVWGVSMILDWADPGYDPPIGVHTAMALVVGMLVGRGVVVRAAARPAPKRRPDGGRPPPT